MPWVESIPSGTSQVGQFPPWARSIWTTISGGLAVEHYWPASGGGSEASKGDLLPGGSRTFVAAQSASSVPSQGTGRAFLASDTTRLLVYESAATLLAGTPYYNEFAVAPSTTTVAGGYWARFSGSFTTTATSGTTLVTFPAAFFALPLIVSSVDSAVWLVTETVSTLTNFTSRWSTLAATGGASVTVKWVALGPVSSASF